MELYTALENRRSIRKYNTDPIPEEKLKRILEAARIAPSWKNQQCWSFIIVRDAAKKTRLADTLHKGNPAVKAIQQAYATLVLCADPSASGNIDGKEYYLFDAALAMQQLMLAAHAEGLGTCCVAWFDEQAAREILNVPPQQKIVALTPLGIPAKEGTMPPRKKLSDFVFAEEWGQKIEL